MAEGGRINYEQSFKNSRQIPKDSYNSCSFQKKSENQKTSKKYPKFPK